MNKELKQLDKLAHQTFGYLVVAAIIPFLVGYLLFYNKSGTSASVFLIGVSLLGFSGSALAALISALNRYANGFEKENGEKVPKEAMGETFNRRMARWFFIRPFLGFFIAPVFLSGLKFFADDPAKFYSTPDEVAFTAFVTGLLAKSILELIKGLFKNIFKA